jgi:hypothetical protein
VPKSDGRPAGPLRSATFDASRVYPLAAAGVSDWAADEPVASLTLSEPSYVEPGTAMAAFAVQRGVPDRATEAHRRDELSRPYRVGQLSMLRIRDAWLETAMCVAGTRDGFFVPDTLRNRRQAVECGYGIHPDGSLRLPQRDIEKFDGPGVLIGLPCGGNYFHWLFEAVVRWLFARDHLQDDATLFVPPLRPMERDALLAVGVSESLIHELPPDRLLQVPVLVVPPRGLQGAARLSPDAINRLGQVSGRPPVRDRRVLISRAGARRRRIANEGEIRDVAARYGFETVATEHLSVCDQLQLFAECEAVMGAHGAGLANVTACHPPGTLIELQPPRLDDPRICLFWRIAAARGLRYAQIVCQSAEHPTAVPDAARDLLVDPTNLDTLLRDLLPHLS